MRRHHLVLILIAALLLVLGIFLLIGVLRGDDTDLERRQEEPRSAEPVKG